jgi:hypothetical protein
MANVVIPDGSNPGDVVGDAELLPGQGWLSRSKVERFAGQMKDGRFLWELAQDREPLAAQEGSNGRVLTQGHHRYVAARLAQVAIPVTIETRRDFWPGPVPFARAWADVSWLDEGNER